MKTWVNHARCRLKKKESPTGGGYLVDLEGRFACHGFEPAVSSSNFDRSVFHLLSYQYIVDLAIHIPTCEGMECIISTISMSGFCH